MEEKDLIKQDISDDEDLGEVYDTVPKFEVWLCGMNETEDDYDYNMDDHLLATFDNLPEAREYAEKVYDDPSEVVEQLNAETKVFSIEVETVIQTAEDVFENIDTTYKRMLGIE